MKINDFKLVSNALAKTTHAFSLCFERIEINYASIAYDGRCFNLSIMCYVDDVGINYMSSESTGNDARLVVDNFYQGLIVTINSNLAELRKEEEKENNEWSEYRVYSHEYSKLSRVASLEMLKDILTGFGR